MTSMTDRCSVTVNTSEPNAGVFAWSRHTGIVAIAMKAIVIASACSMEVGIEFAKTLST